MKKTRDGCLDAGDQTVFKRDSLNVSTGKKLPVLKSDYSII